MSIGKIHQSNITLPFIRIGIVILGILFLALTISRLIYPFTVGTWEAFNWMPATHLLEGKSPYAYAFTPPYSMPPYGIVYSFLIAAGIKLFGFQMWFGRILSVAAFGFCLFAAAQITRKTTFAKEAMWLTILAGLAMFPAQIWIAVMRPDLIAAAFGLAAIRLAFKIEEGDKVNFARVGALILLAAAAFFTKQSFVVPSGIVFLRLLQIKKWRESVYFAAGIAVVVAALMFFLNYTSSGGYFWIHFTHAETLPFSLKRSADVFIEMLKNPTFFFSIICLLIFAFRKRGVFREMKRDKLLEILRSPKFLLLFYVLISGASAFFAAGREGGSANYYIENSFALAIGCGVVFDELKRDSFKNRAVSLTILLILGGAFQFTRIFRGEYFRWQSLSYYREIFDTTAKFTPPGSTCISVYPELVVWNGCSFNFDDFEEYDGTWSPEFNEIFAREIRQGRYAAIIWHHDQLATKFPNYRLIPMTQKMPERFYPVYLYVRNGDERR